ncbi:MAG: nucleotidyl transferase AbiEii/AbiGii toxin family protein [Thermoplasmatales archaeon]|nr:nucleotidyl transferase AbiEii/AbiGii toxin family protein [Candidatus Thermoplasmatota archaeon]MCG2827119.1 nucleotidyl transferase AbiEii/AbiGii toxin family protein [Thermoplasmatales archaeon]
MYAPGIREKVERLSDILIRINEVSMLKNSLSLYGGTALNFLHLKEAPRISEDLDFNYRHLTDEDWGGVRTRLDSLIKTILKDLGYAGKDVRIQAMYNLGRFHIHYSTKAGAKDSIKIETGYTRRIPVLRKDVLVRYVHPVTAKAAYLKTPASEELYANKFCTMLSRGADVPYVRDVFDVGTISKLKFDKDLFIDIVLVEALLSNIDLVNIRFKIPHKSQVNELENLVIGNIDLKEIGNEALVFTENTIKEAISRGWTEFSKEFKKSGKIRLDLMSNPKALHPNIAEHPQLLWLKKKSSAKK